MGKWAAGSLHHEIQLDGEKKKCEASFEEEREREKEEGRWGLIPSGSCSDGGVQQGKKKKMRADLDPTQQSHYAA